MASPPVLENQSVRSNNVLVPDDDVHVVNTVPPSGRGRGSTRKNSSSRGGKGSGTDSDSGRLGEGAVLQHLSSLTTSINAQNESWNQTSRTMTQMAEAVTSLTNRLAGMKSPSRVADVGHPEEEYSSDSVQNDSDNEDLLDVFMNGVPGSAEVLMLDAENPAEVDQAFQSLLSGTEAPPEYGDALPDDVALSVNRIPSRIPSEEEVKKYKESYKTPSNAKYLGTPRVNTEIWSRLPAAARSKDSQLQYAQNFISRSLVAQARVLAEVKQFAKDKPNIFSTAHLQAIASPLLDSMSCLGAAQRDINMKRRASLKTVINPELASLCSSRVPVTEWLFGDNIEQDIKNSRTTAKVLRPLSSSYSSKRSYSSRGAFNSSYKRPRLSPALNSWRGPSTSRQSGSKYQPPRGKFNYRSQGSKEAK